MAEKIIHGNHNVCLQIKQRGNHSLILDRNESSMSFAADENWLSFNINECEAWWVRRTGSIVWNPNQTNCTSHRLNLPSGRPKVANEWDPANFQQFRNSASHPNRRIPIAHSPFGPHSKIWALEENFQIKIQRLFIQKCSSLTNNTIHTMISMWETKNKEK